MLKGIKAVFFKCNHGEEPVILLTPEAKCTVSKISGKTL